MSLVVISGIIEEILRKIDLAFVYKSFFTEKIIHQNMVGQTNRDQKFKKPILFSNSALIIKLEKKSRVELNKIISALAINGLQIIEDFLSECFIKLICKLSDHFGPIVSFQFRMASVKKSYEKNTKAKKNNGTRLDYIVSDRKLCQRYKYITYKRILYEVHCLFQLRKIYSIHRIVNSSLKVVCSVQK